MEVGLRNWTSLEANGTAEAPINYGAGKTYRIFSLVGRIRAPELLIMLQGGIGV